MNLHFESWWIFSVKSPHSTATGCCARSCCWCSASTFPDDQQKKSHYQLVCGRRCHLMVSTLDSRMSGRVQALAGDIVSCSWARHFTLTVPLSTQVYKWIPVNCWGNLTNCGGVTFAGLASRPGEIIILLAASCYRNRDKLRKLWASLGSKASLTTSLCVIWFIRISKCSCVCLWWSPRHSCCGICIYNVLCEEVVNQTSCLTCLFFYVPPKLGTV